MSWAKYSGFLFATKVGIAPAAVTTDGAGSSIDRLGYAHMLATINATVNSGTTPTIDCKVQDSADGSTGWADYVPGVYFDSNNTAQTEAAFPQVTTDGVQKLDVDLSAAKRYVRFYNTVGGTTPNVTVSVVALLGQRDGTAPGASA